MIILTLYGGVNEIGGNKILLESQKAKVWFDFGLSFSALKYFYDEFMNPRKYNGVGDYIEMGLIPAIDGLYRDDYCHKCGVKVDKCKFDGVFLSHPHVDHFGSFNLLHKDMPFFMGECTKLFLQAYEDTGTGNDFLTYREAFTGLYHTKNPKVDRPVKTFRTGKKIEIKDIVVHPIHVDHSIAGAYGYIVETPKGNVAYTGDIRMHGTKSNMTREFVKKSASFDPKVLICEGTRLGEGVVKGQCMYCGSTVDKVYEKMGMTEEEVHKRITEIISKTKQLVVANFPPRDIDRFNTFYKAAVENDRKLVIDLKQAYLLKLLENDDKLDIPKVDDKNILVYLKRMKDGLIIENVSMDRKEKEYSLWMREFLHLKNAVTCKDISQKECVFYCNAWNFGELIDIKPKEGSSYIYSLCEPFCIEMELDMERINHWLEHFKLPFYQAHASGHCSKEELKEIVETINADKVVPIHTENPEGFKEFHSNVKIVKKGEKVEI